MKGCARSPTSQSVTNCKTQQKFHLISPVKLHWRGTTSSTRNSRPCVSGKALFWCGAPTSHMVMEPLNRGNQIKQSELVPKLLQLCKHAQRFDNTKKSVLPSFSHVTPTVSSLCTHQLIPAAILRTFSWLLPSLLEADFYTNSDPLKAPPGL